jgi:hypothetical protein
MTGAATSQLTVVVVPLLGGAALAGCLAVLAAGVPVLVIARKDQETGAARAEAERRARFVVSKGGSVPARRQLGVELASTDLVALLEDTTLPEAGWCEAVCAALADPGVAGAGGPVSVSPMLPRRLQALGWSEYGAFHPGLYCWGDGGPSHGEDRVSVLRLPGNNMAFRRAPLLGTLRGAREGLIEGAVAEALRQQGFELVLHRGMAASYQNADRVGGCLATRFHHGRIYGGGQAACRAPATRLALVARTPLLPVVLTWRTTKWMLRSAPSPAGWLPIALWTMLLHLAWSLGEGVGAIAGRGNSISRWA